MIFRAGRQLIKVRFLVIFCLVCGAGLTWFGWDTVQHYGMRAADGGVLASLATRLLFGGTMIVLGLGMALGMVLFAQFSYVSHITAVGRDQMRITLAGIISSPTFDLSQADVTPAGYNEGYLPTWGVTVNAPWYTIRTGTRQLPLIVDVQGEFLDRTAFLRFFVRHDDTEPG